MSAKAISQREARRLQKRVLALEAHERERRSRYAQSWPGGIDIGDHVFASDTLPSVVRTARTLGHAVVAVGDSTNTIRFVALPHPKDIA